MNSSPSRKNSLRWRGFDYRSARAYGVTICVEGRRCILGDVGDGVVVLSDLGQLVLQALDEIPLRFDGVALDKHVVMPNHVHAILRILPSEGATAPSPSLGDIIRWWKCATTVRARRKGLLSTVAGDARRLWQRGFYDRVLRNDDEVVHARGYILRNPARWTSDPHHPGRR